MSTRVRIVCSLVLALLALGSCLAYVGHVRQEADKIRSEVLERYGGEVVRLIVASDELYAGDVVSALNVSEKEWLADLVPEGALTTLDQCLGKRLSSSVARGMPVCEVQFAEDEHSLDVPADLVALSFVLTDRLALSAGVQLGSELLAYEVKEGRTELIAAGVRVVELPQQSTVFGQGNTITLALAPEDVAAVLSASTAGSLRLALPGKDVDVLPLEEVSQEVQKDLVRVESVAADKAVSEKAEEAASEKATAEKAEAEKAAAEKTEVDKQTTLVQEEQATAASEEKEVNNDD